jgi:hypothetical protein
MKQINIGMKRETHGFEGDKMSLNILFERKLDDLLRYKRNLDYQIEAINKERAAIDNDILKLFGSTKKRIVDKVMERRFEK